MNTARLLRNIIVVSILFNVAACCPDYGGKADSTGAPAPSLLNVVDVRQETSYTCGVACAQAILNYYGIDQRQDRLAEQFGTTEEAGTSPQQIVAGLESYGLTATLKEQTTLEDLRINIQNQIPTMVAIQAWLETYPAPDWSKDWEDGHWVIVLGMDDQNVYFEDPSLLGTRGVLTQEEFLARWHDYTGDAPCCDANDYLWQHLSISVKGNAVKTPPFTLIQ